MAPNVPGLLFSFTSFILCLVYPKKKKKSGVNSSTYHIDDDDDDNIKEEEGLLIKSAFSLESLDDYNNNDNNKL
jgi:hypothetical protein